MSKELSYIDKAIDVITERAERASEATKRKTLGRTKMLIYRCELCNEEVRRTITLDQYKMSEEVLVEFLKQDFDSEFHAHRCKVETSTVITGNLDNFSNSLEVRQYGVLKLIGIVGGM